MNLTAVADAFIGAKDYRTACAQFPAFSLLGVPFFGVDDRTQMREIVRRIETGGPTACEPPAALWDLLAETEVLMVHLCPVSAALLERAPKLKLILTNRGGTENIDVEAATARGIPVLSNPAHNANAVAEYTVGLILAEMRNIGRAHAALKTGLWRERFPNSGTIYELRGQTVGLIGFGTIARLVARKLAGFDCTLLVSDPFIQADDPDLAAYACRKVELHELLAESDVVSLHARSSGQPLIGEAELAQMKPSAYLINTARAHLLDSEALCRALTEGRLRGAALDVFEAEPVPADHPLLALDNVTLTNHRGGDTVNSYADSPAMLLTEAEKLLSGDTDHVRFWINKQNTCK